MKPAAISLLFVILLAMPGLALGKVPWSSVEIVPAAPVAGEPLTVIVRFWDDAAHTTPSTSWPDHGSGRLEFESAAGRVSLEPTEIAVGTFRAEITLTEGTWRLVAVQEFGGTSGPSEVELATVAVAGAPGTSAPIGAAVIGVALVSAGILWRRRRSTSRSASTSVDDPRAHVRASAAFQDEPHRQDDENCCEFHAHASATSVPDS
jgi:hypothetical protein